MQFFFIVLIITFIIFLFSLYTFSHDDFILLRKDISTEDVFNYAFISGVFSLLSARIFYILVHPDPAFLNPLAFLIFPYFPGLSLLGGIVGGGAVIVFLARRKGFPVGRILDFFSLSFLASMPVGFLGYMLLSKDRSYLLISQFFFFLLLFFVFVFILIPKFKTGKKDGILGLIFLVTISLNYLVKNFILKSEITSIENVVSLAILAPSLFMLLRIILRERISVK
jgi:prolipoprotein diacylglyceryltransferase